MIRIDDFPHGDKILYQSQKKCYKNELIDILSILESNNVQYMLGVSPLLCSQEHIDILKEYIKTGNIVMHGFDHGFSKIEDWSVCKNFWADGGEFSFYSESEIDDLYISSFNILNQIGSFNAKHFIPPFNCFNQKLLNVLNKHDVQYLHGCNTEFYTYGQYGLNYGNIKFVQYELGKGYDYAYKAIRFVGLQNICLHWCYDIINDAKWRDSYINLAIKIGNTQ